MKKTLLLSFLLVSISFAFSQGICNEAGNIIMFGNYDGGEININIDQDVSNIQIGVCTYESVNINITGTYAGNVTKVMYAGYDSYGTTSVTGVDAGVVDILVVPPVTLEDPDGNVYMVCAYECDTDYIPGGCNTVDQMVDYFLTYLDGSLRFSYMHYETFGTSTYYISDGGNCCVGAPACVLAIDAGKDQAICPGESANLNVSGADEYAWSAGVVCDPPCSSALVTPSVTTTYIVTGTDDEGCSGVDSVTVTIAPIPEAVLSESGDTLYAGGGTEYIWLLNGEVIEGADNYYYVAGQNGAYQVIAINTQGCSDTSDVLDVVLGIGGNNIYTGLSVFPNPANDNCTITIQNNVSGELNCTLVNSAGQIITSVHYSKTGTEQQFLLSLQSVLPGIYTVNITSDTFTVSRKLVVLKD